MKNQKNNFVKSINQTLKGVCIVSLSLFLNSTMHSQNETKLGISAYSTLSGQGFGTIYTPGVFYKLNDCKVELGLNVQKRKLNLSGLRLNFEYTLFDEAKEYDNIGAAGDLELILFSTIKYNWNAYLSKPQINEEKMTSKESNIPFDNLQFATIEAYTGFGLNVRLAKKLKFCNSIGIGAWKTLKGERNLYRQDNGLSILLNTGLSLDF